ncbi:DUF4190 domain-containing protein [Sanguibacter sp. HDW7]|uniref:DUF4190 domain-containing protein n=1 Tax=Sanguibacter sp. HDW7 TaxID=2714931 RepID=UPI00140A6CBF|nr:DUF4190 domain-containing protein [Sanguibacter sp. HDW7]QIK82789.1 DUF4190 domain-containing protein [Sanguibacter sp. HDW7]
MTDLPPGPLHPHGPPHPPGPGFGEDPFRTPPPDVQRRWKDLPAPPRGVRTWVEVVGVIGASVAVFCAVVVNLPVAPFGDNFATLIGWYFGVPLLAVLAIAGLVALSLRARKVGIVLWTVFLVPWFFVNLALMLYAGALPEGGDEVLDRWWLVTSAWPTWVARAVAVLGALTAILTHLRNRGGGSVVPQVPRVSLEAPDGDAPPPPTPWVRLPTAASPPTASMPELRAPRSRYSVVGAVGAAVGAVATFAVVRPWNLSLLDHTDIAVMIVFGATGLVLAGGVAAAAGIAGAVLLVVADRRDAARARKCRRLALSLGLVAAALLVAELGGTVADAVLGPAVPELEVGDPRALGLVTVLGLAGWVVALLSSRRLDRVDGGHAADGQGPPPVPGAAPEAVNVAAVLSLVLGCVGGLVGAVLGHVALRQIALTGERGRPVAIIGIVLSYLGLALILVALVWTPGS